MPRLFSLQKLELQVKLNSTYQVLKPISKILMNPYDPLGSPYTSQALYKQPGTDQGWPGMAGNGRKWLGMAGNGQGCLGMV